MNIFSHQRKSGFSPATMPYLLVVVLLGLTFVTPLLRWTSGPCTNDRHLLFHRLAALRYAWENGAVFSRWLPDVAFGYGYPFFLYREAPPLYLALIPHWLGVPLPAAINIFYTLSILAAGLFMFLWVRDVFDERAAVVSAVAYMAAPYLLTDVMVLGIQPETFALALMPFICWAGRRFMLNGTAATFIVSAAGIALLALSHNISTLIFTPFLIVYLLVAGWLKQLNWRTLLGRWFLVLVLGLGLSAFYVGPALLELDEITIDQSINNRNNDFRFNYASAEEIFSVVLAEDPTLINPPFLLRLGLVPVGLAILGFISILWHRHRQRRGHIIFMAVASVVFILMALDWTQPIWDNLPLIRFVQFPWRFVGRAALPIAFLAGVPFSSAVESIAQPAPLRRYGWLLAIAAILLLSFEALPLLYPANCQGDSYPSINSVHNYERSSGLVGVDPTGSYFPVTVQNRPDGSSLEADYQVGRQPQRFDPSALPAGARLLNVEYETIGAKILLDSPVPFDARYLSFAFPGWIAAVDGEAVRISPSQPEGLITFPVPAGQHTIEIRWQTTPLRSVFMFLSLAAFLGAAITAIFLFRNQPARPTDQVLGESSLSVPSASNNKILIFLLLAALFILGFKLLIVDRIETPFKREGPPPVTYPSGLVAAELQLAGHKLSEASVAAGEVFDIDLAWLAIETPVAEYQSNIWLSGPEGLTWSDKETTRPRTLEESGPTNFWLPGHWAWDSRQVKVLPGTPPGQYDIVLTLFDKADLGPVTFMTVDGSVVGPTAVIGQIEITRPYTKPAFSPQYPLEETINGLKLLGYNLDRSKAAPGELLLLTLFWEKPADFSPSSSGLELTLQDEAGDNSQTWLLDPVRPGYPPEEWQEGERLRGQHALRLSAGLPDGDYRFLLEGLPLEPLKIKGPERLFEAPPYDKTIQANFDNLVELEGYTIIGNRSDMEEPITITLIWQGKSEMPVSYRVFIHLVDDQGQIMTQSDAEPAGWLRPTTGWAPGEYIIDEHQLMIPAGLLESQLSINVGMYDAQTGDRLPVNGGEFISLPAPPGR